MSNRFKNTLIAYTHLILPTKKSGQSKKPLGRQITHEKTPVSHHNSMEK
ncbi:hypothetical protein RINTU1_35650 [Candidatus Regiella insecticola]|uniref:Uncharacterized protein n=1 Tax=Candidatus Regiella insecticola TaxID=138073 RepID=A0A6L2ZT58_9ENTR|nr:hypothetical protein RINTU1_35650 [Candidatus Regiella insecticola]